MSAFSGIDYREAHFIKKQLTPIVGEPTFVTLELLLKQLKSNARSVHSNLGGGQHGHLGLVISPPSYALLSPTPFTRPVFPGAQAIIPNNTTQHAARSLRIDYNEDLRVYHEVNNVDQALKQQIIEAVEPMYLTAVKNRTSDTITIPVHEVMDHLFTSYGDVTPHIFQIKEAAIKSSTWDPTTPIDNLYQDIEELVDLSGRAGVPMTPEQSITIAYVILWKTNVLQDYLKTWNTKLVADKTWTNFKIHFRDGIKEYKQLQAPQVHDSIYSNQANLLQTLRDDLRNVIVDEIQTQVAHLATTSPPTELSQQDYHSHSPSHYDYPIHDNANMSTQFQHMSNSIAEYKQLVPQLINQVKQLQQVIQDLGHSSIGPPTQITSDTSTLSRTTSTAAKKWIFKKPFHLYCSTHGLCAHSGTQCNAPNDKHKPDATFFDRKGGNNRNCERAKNPNA